MSEVQIQYLNFVKSEGSVSCRDTHLEMFPLLSRSSLLRSAVSTERVLTPLCVCVASRPLTFL
jgi:hypothetical protein